MISGLPAYLRRYVREQDPARYTEQDHAVWRYTLQQLRRVLAEAAHPVYLQGLEGTGICLERVPSIDEMNACLKTYGWAAVVVDGFIPPAIFMEFQARRILPIALDMRGIDQILYTPAPDIVHEAAGHAPFIVDPEYAEYLQHFGEVGMKAISTRADHAVYEAVRGLSIVKGLPTASAQDIAAAQAILDAALAGNDHRSEAALLSRLHWWTVEYGLVGQVDDYRIYGAGLLSSLGESVSCQDDALVRKRPLTVEAILTPYDITRPQPQLFVARNCAHLKQVLQALADRMAFRIGGAEGLQRAIDSGTVCTARYSSGVEVSGILSRVLADAAGNPVYLATSGPTQLACESRELPGHGIATHPEGFGSPLGAVLGLPRCLSEASPAELALAGIVTGQRLRLVFVSGVVVEGRLEQLLRRNDRNLLLGFEDCRVTGPQGEILFEPSWGRYDMAVGERISSVWGGAADRSAYDCLQAPSPAPTPRTNESASDRRLFSIYEDIRALRDAGDVNEASLTALLQRLEEFPRAWLPRLNLREIADGALAERLEQQLRALADSLAPEARRLIHLGLLSLEPAEATCP